MIRRYPPNGFPEHHGVGFHLIPFLCFVLLVAVAVALGVMLWRNTRGGIHPVSASHAPARDQALAELRLRYARGDVDRAEFLQRAADLGETNVAPPPHTPPASAPGETPAD